MLETGLLPAAIKKNALFLGNAGLWRNDALKVGLPVTSTPSAGARGLVVWPPNTKGAGSVGHVAFLEEVYPDGRVRITEANWPTGSGIKERILTPAQYAGVSFVRLENAQTNSYNAPPAKPGQQRQYVVRSGDTLSAIALRELGNANRWTEIKKVDGSTFTAAEAQSIKPGQSIYLPVSYQPGPGVAVTPKPSSTPKATGDQRLLQILKDYQVQDDKIKVWSPKLGGFIPIPITNVEMTETEAKLLDSLTFSKGILGLFDFKNIRDQAFSQSEKQFPEPPNKPEYIPNERKQEWVDQDGHRDAFRHAYWNSMLTRKFGEKWTSQFTTAHEALPGNPATREAMDLYNNEVGRQIAINNPNASDAKISDLVRQAIDNGKLLVIDRNGNLAWSNQVPFGKHGLTDGKAGGGGQPVPNGNASVK
jgi:surface antigen